MVVDAKSYLYLNGTTLDYVTEGLQGGFTFVNPQAKSSLGVGPRSRPRSGPGMTTNGPRRARSYLWPPSG